MTVWTKSDGSRESNDCDLCYNRRLIGVGGYKIGEEPECPWCHAVRMKFGSYWYPIDKNNEHLFKNK